MSRSTAIWLIAGILLAGFFLLASYQAHSVTPNDSPLYRISLQQSSDRLRSNGLPAKPEPGLQIPTCQGVSCSICLATYEGQGSCHTWMLSLCSGCSPVEELDSNPDNEGSEPTPEVLYWFLDSP